MVTCWGARPIYSGCWWVHRRKIGGQEQADGAGASLVLRGLAQVGVSGVRLVVKRVEAR